VPEPELLKGGGAVDDEGRTVQQTELQVGHGCALLVWLTQTKERDPFDLGFLHRFYCQALDAAG
jgi:hypothetical protein